MNHLNPVPLRRWYERWVTPLADASTHELLAVQRTVSRLVVADFELTNRPGAKCGASAGERATFAFLIDADDHIARFILIDGSAPTAPGGDGVASA